MHKSKALLATALFLGASLSQAEGIKFGVQMGFASGGDEIASNDLYSIDGGSGSYFGAFTMLPIFDKDDLHLKLAINHFSDFISYSTSFGYSEEISFSRLPIDALLTKQLGRLMVGGGVTYHLNTEYEEIINGDSTVTDIDDPLGLVLEANFRLFAGFNIGARYTNIAYKSPSNGKTLDGTSTAFSLGYIF